MTIVLLRSCRDAVCPGPLDDPSHAACFGGECGDPRCTPETPEYCPSPLCEDAGDCAPPLAQCAEVRCEGGLCLTVGQHDACEADQWCSPELGCVSVSDPCEGVTCEGGGECVPHDAMPTCLCNDGRWVIGTRCEAASGCISSECDPGQVCRFDTGRCGAVDSLCGWPSSEGGSVMRYNQCNTENPCGDGLFCLASRYVLDPSTEEYGLGDGRCMPTCDPCAPSCPSGLHCVALGERPGGFCLSGSLIEVGSPCGARIGSCVSDAMCAPDVRICEAICRPLDPSWETAAFDSGFPSDDCRAGELCRRPMGSSERGSFVCHRGEVVAIGQACDFETFCEPGIPCSTVPMMDWGSPYALCSYDCQTTPCPDGMDCVDLRDPHTFSFHTCVPNHALPYGAKCVEDHHCSEDLVCRSGYCQLP